MKQVGVTPTNSSHSDISTNLQTLPNPSKN